MKTPAPSQIVTITFAGTQNYNAEGKPTRKGAIVLTHNEKYIVEQLFMDDGHTIFSASTALPLSDSKVFITSVFQPKYSVCTTKQAE